MNNDEYEYLVESVGEQMSMILVTAFLTLLATGAILAIAI